MSLSGCITPISGGRTSLSTISQSLCLRLTQITCTLWMILFIYLFVVCCLLFQKYFYEKKICQEQYQSVKQFGSRSGSTLFKGYNACADPDSFVRGGSTLTFFLLCFLVDEGREGPNTTIGGPSSARQRNGFAILITFCWRGDDGRTLNF